MENKQDLTPKNNSYVVPAMSSKKYSPEKKRISSPFVINLPNDINLEKQLNSAKKALKVNCRQLIEEFDEKLKEILEEDRKTGLLVETALQEVEKGFAEEKALFKEVERAADDCIEANLNYIAKSKNFLATNRTNKRKLEQFIDNLVPEEEPPTRKPRNM